MKNKLLILLGVFTVFQFVFSYNYVLGYEIKNKKMYYYGRLIKEVDIKTFKVLDEYYSMDRNNIFFEEKKIKGVDLKTFEILNDEFSKDKNTAYHENEKIIGSDPETFIVYGEHLAKDKNNYYLGKIVLVNLNLIDEDVDNGNSKNINGIYVKDKENDSLYFISKFEKFAYGMNETDLKTFKFYKKQQKIDGVIFDSKDKNNYYYNGIIVKKK